MNQELSRQERRAIEREGSVSTPGANNNVWLWMVGIILMVIVFGAGLAFVGRGGSDRPIATDIPTPVDETDHRFGSADAPVEIIEYSDFQCPACRAYSEVLTELKTELSGKFSLVYRHYPLPYHLNAEEAARASEAAALQGKFWEMHDKLFANQDSWSKVANPKNIFVGYAVELGLDQAKFAADFDSDGVVAKVGRDLTDGAQIGVPGTPTFFVNGEIIANPRNKQAFAELINSLASQDVVLPPDQQN